jgi:hypothetical protein
MGTRTALIASGVVAFCLVFGSMVVLANGSDTALNRVELTAGPNTPAAQLAADRPPPAAIAAACAGFPATISQRIGELHRPEGQIILGNLPDSYEIRSFIVRVDTGECLEQPAEQLPKIGPDQALRLMHAVGIVDFDDVRGEGLPFYVVAELEGGPQNGSQRMFVMIRLPEPRPPESEPGPPPRIA